jgi:hypothetical protein
LFSLLRGGTKENVFSRVGEGSAVRGRRVAFGITGAFVPGAAELTGTMVVTTAISPIVLTALHATDKITSTDRRIGTGLFKADAHLRY